MFKRFLVLAVVLILTLALVSGCSLDSEFEEGELKVSTTAEAGIETKEELEGLVAVDLLLLNRNDRSDRHYIRRRIDDLEVEFMFENLKPGANYKVLAIGINTKGEMIYLTSSLVVKDSGTNYLVIEISPEDFKPRPQPDVSEAVPSQDCIWPPNKRFVEVEIENVIDPAGGEIDIEIIEITSDEPVSGKDGKPDAFGLGTSTAALRADRDGGGSGRVYEITFLARSKRGGKAVGSVNVCVPHDMSGREAVDEGQRYDATVID